MENYKSVSVVARRYGVHRKTVLLWIRTGKIEAVRLTPTSPYRIPMSQFDKVQ